MAVGEREGHQPAESDAQHPRPSDGKCFENRDRVFHTQIQIVRTESVDRRRSSMSGEIETDDSATSSEQGAAERAIASEVVIAKGAESLMQEQDRYAVADGLGEDFVRSAIDNAIDRRYGLCRGSHIRRIGTGAFRLRGIQENTMKKPRKAR